MKIANNNVMNFAPAAPGWVAVFNIGGETGEITCPIVGWATIVRAHMNDGTVTTDVEPGFLYGDMVWIETELREHQPVLSAVQIRPDLFGGMSAA